MTMLLTAGRRSNGIAFYRKQGFRDTGRLEDGEVVLSLRLDG